MQIWGEKQRFSNASVRTNYRYRPIVCIKTTVFKEKYEETLESNYIGKAINADKYGEEVIGYECTDEAAQTEAGAWRLFYQNAAYTYLISDNLIDKGDSLLNLYTAANWGDKTGADVNEIGQGLNPMLKEAGFFFTSDNTNGNIKATGYLTDTEQWSKYENEDSIFAIGGPSLELFAKSFNATSAIENRGITIGQSTARNHGYWWSTSTQQQNEYLKPEYNHGIYHTENNNNTYLWWFCSPGAAENEGKYEGVFHVWEESGVDRLGMSVTEARGHYRPIVCIKTPVFKEKYEATLESNYIGEAINAEKYGQKVNGYQSEDATAQEEAGAWRLFYQNAAYTYLISDKGITLEDDLYTLYEAAGWAAKTAADVSAIGQGLNPMLKEAGGFVSSNNEQNMLATAYLTDPTQWEKYKGPDATFAIGGASIELFMQSFNAASKAEGRETTISVTVDPLGYNGVSR